MTTAYKRKKDGAYVKHVNKKGKTYYYFKVPAALSQFYSKQLISIGTDKDESHLRAKELLESAYIVNGRTPTQQEYYTARKMLANATGRSKKKGMDSDIDAEWIVQQMRYQDYRCAITRLAFNSDWKDDRGSRRNAFAPSLDRIDNSRGYTKENCRVVLSAVNYAMNEWCLKIYLMIAEAAVKNAPLSTAPERPANAVWKLKQNAPVWEIGQQANLLI